MSFSFEKQGSAEGRFFFLKNKVIIIPYNNPRFWIADYIKKTENILSQENIVFSFLWQDSLSIKEIFTKKIKNRDHFKFKFISRKGGVYYLRPIHFLPLRRFSSVELINLIINSYLLKIFIFFSGNQKKEKIVWIFHPDFWLLPRIFGRSYLSLYDCIDYFSSINANEEEKIRQKEEKLIKNVQIMTVMSQALKNLYRTKKKEVTVTSQGFSLDTFQLQSKIKLPKNNLIFKLKKPIIGYAGGINYRLDYDLLIKVVQKNPQLTFLFIGPLQKDYFKTFAQELEKLKNLKNAHFLENQPRELLAEIIKYFDICLIPYDIEQEFNKFCYPMKVFEYFYVGKPTISTPIEELKRLQPYVKIAKDAQEFTREIRKILKTGWPKGYVQKQKKLAIANSWANKIEKIDQILLNQQK